MVISVALHRSYMNAVMFHFSILLFLQRDISKKDVIYFVLL